MISDKRVEQAVRYLAETDKEHARLKAEYKAKEALTKTIIGFEFNDAQGAVEARRQAAYSSQAYIDHIEQLKKLEVELQEIWNKRQTETVIIDLYRTLSANQRKGNI